MRAKTVKYNINNRKQLKNNNSLVRKSLCTRKFGLAKVCTVNISFSQEDNSHLANQVIIFIYILIFYIFIYVRNDNQTTKRQKYPREPSTTNVTRQMSCFNQSESFIKGRCLFTMNPTERRLLCGSWRRSGARHLGNALFYRWENI